MKDQFSSWVLLLLLSLIWGSSFILMKLGMRDFSSNHVAALRLTFALVFVLPFWFFHFKKEHLLLWKYFLASAVFGNLLPAFLFTMAETGISSSMAGMLNSFTPMATLLMGALLWKSKTGLFSKLGVITGLAGACGLFFFDETEGNNSLLFSCLVLVATICYGFSVNVIRQYLGNVNPVTNTVWSMSMAGIPAAIYLAFDQPALSASMDGQALASLGYIAILGVIGSAVSVILFNQLIRKSSALFASSVTYLIPVVAVFWGIAFSERIEAMQYVSMSLILLGVWLINKK